MTRRRFALLATVLVAVNVFFWLAQGSFALPQALVDRLFGPQMIRSEVVVGGPLGTQDFRVDRGMITSVVPGEGTIRERDATGAQIPFRPETKILGPNGIRRPPRALRPGIRVLVVRPLNGPAQMIQLEGPR